MLAEPQFAASHIISDEAAQSHSTNLSACFGTFLARIRFNNGPISSQVRGFCDSGSQINLIKESCVQSMRLHRSKTKVPISGIGASTVANGIVDITLVLRTDENIQIRLKACIMPRISDQLPDKSFDSPFYDSIANEELADPTFNQPNNVDLLLGAGAWAAIICDNIRRTQFNGHYAVAQSTIFGFVIYGEIPSAAHIRLRSCHTAL